MPFGISGPAFPWYDASPCPAGSVEYTGPAAGLLLTPGGQLAPIAAGVTGAGNLAQNAGVNVGGVTDIPSGLHDIATSIQDAGQAARDAANTASKAAGSVGDAAQAGVKKLGDIWSALSDVTRLKGIGLVLIGGIAVLVGVFFWLGAGKSGPGPGTVARAAVA